MMSIFQKTKELVAIFVLASVLWMPSVVHCAAEVDVVSGDINEKLWEEVEYSSNTPDTIEAIRRLVDDCGANVSYVSPESGRSVLGSAAKRGLVDVAKELIMRGALIDAGGTLGETALHIASVYGRNEIVRLLLDLKASIDIKSKGGANALTCALTSGGKRENKELLIRMLLEQEPSSGEIASVICTQLFNEQEVASKQSCFKVLNVKEISCDQVQAIQQMHRDCGLHALANAYVLDQCIRAGLGCDAEVIHKKQPEIYEQIKDYFVLGNELRDPLKFGVVGTDLIDLFRN